MIIVFAVTAVLLLLLQGLLWRRMMVLLPELQSIERSHDRLAQALRDEFARNRDETAQSLRHLREELAQTHKYAGDNVAAQLLQMRTLVDTKLDQMRQTVDEKLQGSLEKRLGDSFRVVSERLEQVHKGLGEMQTLAAGVGDLKKVLSNVKTRGTWGEVQLGAILEQVLNQDQFGRNVVMKENGGPVEFAVKMPGRDTLLEPVWLPIDAKFPLEDYQRLIDAQERADNASAEESSKALEVRIRTCAKDIASKYINPPMSTDFAILFLPIEGLFAEVIRRPGLSDQLQRDYRVVIAGPTTLWSILSSLQMGFKSLAIQKRSSEVWTLLAAVKTEWGKYGDILERVQEKLQEASNTIDRATTRSKAIGRKLKDVEAMPTHEADLLLLEDGAA